MRVLHTADWHLGRSFHGESLLAAQAAAVDHVVAAAREARVDAVLIAGDVYDRALPPVDAVRLADEALRRISELCPVVLISGNHDSAARLGFAATLLERAGVHVRTRAEAVGDPVEIRGHCIYAVPYLEPDLVAAGLGCARSHAAVLSAAMDRVRADLARRPPATRSVVVAHAFVAGAAPSGSERELGIGGAASVAAGVFGGVTYAALGHLHGPQRVGSRARYAGSPVPFSFAEAGRRKSVAVVDLERDAATELVDFPVWRPLALLRGGLDELLTDPAHAQAERAWVHVTLTDPARRPDAMERLRRRFPHTVALAYEPQGASPAAGGSYRERLRGLDDAALLEHFVRDVRGTEPAPEEATLLHAALDAQRVAEVAR